MDFSSLFRGKSKFFLVYLGIFGIINSLWASALLLLINNKVTGEALPFFHDQDWLVYVVLILVSFACTAAFQSYMIKLTHNLGNELGISIFDKLRFTDLEDFNKLGEEKVRTAMEDVKVIQTFPSDFLEFFNALIIVLIGIGYMFWVDAASAGVVTAILVMLGIIYVYRDTKIERSLDEARDLNDVYQRNVNDFLRGFREVKMSTERSDKIFDGYISKNRHKANKLTIKSLIRLLENELMGTYVWYLMIGVILFLLPVVLQMEASTMTNFLVTLLFLMGPSITIIGLFEEFINFRIAWSRLDKFHKEINAASAYQLGHGQAFIDNQPFRNLRFEDITYEYFDQKKATTFRLKPLNLEIERGEIIFITGGNGSGKSTFIHLLAGLYMPKSGVIYMNNKRIEKANMPAYRNKLSCIFTDNYLFSENYDGYDLSDENETFNALIEKMRLTDIINFDDEQNKVFHTLSKGQQKRMALIYAMMEDKDIFIFDEWAAEQDPIFRRFFYKNIIPELKAMGKTVVAVTHDDAYFDCAERILKFDYGEIAEDVRLTSPVELDLELEAPVKLSLNGHLE